jgi:hypothetical protein
MPQAPPPRRPGSLADVVMLEPVELVDAEVVEAVPPRRDLASRPAGSQFRGSQAIAQHAQQLGAEVDLADDKLEAHLHQVFDHKLGSFQRSVADGDASAKQALQTDQPGALGFAAMLANPQSLRNAILLSEILRRPEENW